LSSITYRKKISLTRQQASGPIRLRLGKVGCIAGIQLNDKNLGVVWTAPWSDELTGVVKPGENLLEIEVANVWNNRPIGDAGLPETQRRTKTNVTLQQGEGRRQFTCSAIQSTDQLEPSDLMGPVRLEFGRIEKVKYD
jgi:hypothetical protein